MSLLHYEKNVDKKFADDVLTKFCSLYENPKISKDILVKIASKMIISMSEKDREFAKLVLEVLRKRYPDTPFDVKLD